MHINRVVTNTGPALPEGDKKMKKRIIKNRCMAGVIAAGAEGQMKTIAKRGPRKINGVIYDNKQEFLCALIKNRLNSDYARELKCGDKYRVSGSDYLGFRSKKEAADFWRATDIVVGV